MICYFCNKPYVHKYCCNEHKCFQFMNQGKIHFQFNSFFDFNVVNNDDIILHLILNVKDLTLDYYDHNSNRIIYSTKFDAKMKKTELFDLCAKTIPLKLKKSSHFI